MLALIVSLMMTAFDPSVLTVPIVHAKEPPKEWTQEMVKELAIEQAEKYGLHKKRFLATLECENNFEAKGQSNHYYKGKRENSWGAAQYWLDEPMALEDGTPITREIAENPALAVPAMAWHFSEGRATRWSCYNLLFGKY